MSRYWSILIGAAFAAGISGIFGLTSSGKIGGTIPTVRAEVPMTKPNSELAELKAEVASLKLRIATYAAMNDVDYHSQNLWFAGMAGNWPLAEFYWEKILLHMRWTKVAYLAEKDVSSHAAKLAENAAAIEKSPNMQVGNAIQKRDTTMFATTYRSMLQGCYNCHKAVDKPFLRPRMPVKPAQAIINVDPKATWPD
jgi:hypothetical protein